MKELKITKEIARNTLAITLRNNAVIGILIFCIFILTVTINAFVLQGVNLLGDPGFDLSTNPGGFPNSGFWNDDHIGQAGAVLDGLHYKSSPYSMHVYTGQSGSDYLSRPYHNDISSSAGNKYRGGAYIWTPSGFAWQDSSKAFIRISFRNTNHSEISYYDSPYYEIANSSWQFYELTTGPAPSGTAYIRFIIYLQKPPGTVGQSIINVDDCLLEDWPNYIKRLHTEIPVNFKLYQNYPNPFNPATLINFDLPKSMFTKLIVYDMLGKEVATLLNEKLNAGSYEVDWDASGYTSGVYFYKLQTGEYSETKRMVYMK
ncbi:MAG: T9SS type A sorting domain-containing protein [Ignavibacteria bacterium]|nr:T9SS type A sorting domain-containing protein [Ignavibacteria bacterium]